MSMTQDIEVVCSRRCGHVDCKWHRRHGGNAGVADYMDMYASDECRVPQVGKIYCGNRNCPRRKCPFHLVHAPTVRAVRNLFNTEVCTRQKDVCMNLVISGPSREQMHELMDNIQDLLESKGYNLVSGEWVGERERCD